MLTLLLLTADVEYRLAFCRGGDVWTIAPDGSQGRRIAERFKFGGKGEDRPIVASPDGKTLIYWDHEAGHWDLVACDAEGKRRRNLTKDLAGGCRSASYSRDGKWIAFMCDEPNGLYVMRSDGSGKRRLSSLGHRDEPPVWSPDGKWIAWVGLNERATLAVYAIDLAGGEPVQVGPGNNPSWAKPSERIIFSGGIWSLRDRTITPFYQRWVVSAIQSPVGSWTVWHREDARPQTARVTRGSTIDAVWSTTGEALRRFTWSADGKYLAFYGTSGLRVLDLTKEPPQDKLVARNCDYVAWVKP
jgi:Tol biopolymer transport system component